MEIIAYKAPWSRFAPNSLVKQGDYFFVGMHAGVTVVKASRFGIQDVRFYGPQGQKNCSNRRRSIIAFAEQCSPEAPRGGAHGTPYGTRSSWQAGDGGAPSTRLITP